MLIDDFKTKYTTIPFATYSRNYERNTSKNNIDTLFHMHKEIEILLVLEGGAKLYTDTDAYDIEKGDIIFIAPYVMHRYTIIAESNFQHYCLCFDAELLYDKKLKERLEDGTVTVSNIIKNEKCRCFIKEAFEADRQRKAGWELRVIGNLSLFFATLAECGHLSTAEEASGTSVYYRIVDLIAREFTNNITSAYMAKQLYMNSSYFCRLFRKNFGYCFQNYLCMYRIEKSKSLLKNTEMSVSEIALKVGFNSFSYYSKSFKEYNSVTPSEYRNNERSKG